MGAWRWRRRRRRSIGGWQCAAGAGGAHCGGRVNRPCEREAVLRSAAGSGAGGGGGPAARRAAARAQRREPHDAPAGAAPTPPYARGWHTRAAARGARKARPGSLFDGEECRRPPTPHPALTWRAGCHCHRVTARSKIARAAAAHAAPVLAPHRALAPHTTAPCARACGVHLPRHAGEEGREPPLPVPQVASPQGAGPPGPCPRPPSHGPFGSIRKHPFMVVLVLTFARCPPFSHPPATRLVRPDRPGLCPRPAGPVKVCSCGLVIRVVRSPDSGGALRTLLTRVAACHLKGRGRRPPCAHEDGRKRASCEYG